MPLRFSIIIWVEIYRKMCLLSNNNTTNTNAAANTATITTNRKCHWTSAWAKIKNNIECLIFISPTGWELHWVIRVTVLHQMIKMMGACCNTSRALMIFDIGKFVCDGEPVGKVSCMREQTVHCSKIYISCKSVKAGETRQLLSKCIDQPDQTHKIMYKLDPVYVKFSISESVIVPCLLLCNCFSVSHVYLPRCYYFCKAAGFCLWCCLDCHYRCYWFTKWFSVSSTV